MEDILALRHEAARLLGFGQLRRVLALATKHGAQRAGGGARASCAARARAARPAALREFAELEEFAGGRLEAWDVAFFSERLRERASRCRRRTCGPISRCRACSTGLFEVATPLRHPFPAAPDVHLASPRRALLPR
jgi:oligopeptidase A